MHLLWKLLRERIYNTCPFSALYGMTGMYGGFGGYPGLSTTASSSSPSSPSSSPLPPSSTLGVAASQAQSLGLNPASKCNSNSICAIYIYIYVYTSWFGNTRTRVSETFLPWRRELVQYIYFLKVLRLVPILSYRFLYLIRFLSQILSGSECRELYS